MAKATDFSTIWEQKTRVRDRATNSGKVTIEFVKTKRGGRIQVSAPYNSQFIVKARQLSGKWRAKTKVWSFPSAAYELVLGYVKALYGDENVIITGA